MAIRIGVKTAVRAAVFAYGASLSTTSLALGLGEIEMQSFLNEPLTAEVALLDTRRLTTDDIRIRLAGIDDFDRLGVDRSYFLTSIEFEVVVDETTGQGVIRLSTQEAVLEPYLDIIIEARWPTGRLLREYTVLVDPPAFRQDVVTVSASERVEATNPDKPAVAEPAPDMVEEPTGDSVAMRESSLPPGEMPDRAFSAETAGTPAAGNRYMVKRDETLWQIASQGKPEGISVQQAMLDIQRVNQEAFIDGNINRIKAGYIIYLPAAGEVSSDDLSQAIDEVRAQNREWQAARSAPGVTTAASLRVSAEPSAPVSSDSGSASAAADRGDMRTDAGTVQPEVESSDMSSGETAPAGADVASAELASQLNAMAERLDTLEQIVSLKDQQIATLEQALREAREAAAAAPTPAAPAVDPVASSPAPAATAPATPEPEVRSSATSIPWLPIGGGLLVLILAVLFVLRRRSQDDADDKSVGRSADDSADDDVFAGVSLQREEPTDVEEAPLSTIQAVVSEAPEQPVDDETEAVDEEPAEDDEDDHDRGGSRGYGERKHDDYIDEGAGGDALAEADIYIAYGRYLQAIELLDTAIENEPGNSAYRVKLIELYVDMGEADSAQAQIEELRKHGDADAVARAEALVGGGGAVDDGDDFDLALEPAADPAPVAPAEEALAIEMPETDSLELDLEDASVAEPAAPIDATGADLEEEIEFAHLEIEDEGSAGSDDLDFDTEEELDLSDALGADAPGDSASDDSGAGEDLLIADDADQMATKLDLARAYLDMGDSDGAKAILEEVADAGTAEQKQEATDLLSRIG